MEGAALNLHQIGLGILLYSQDFGGQYPDSLATLIVHENLSPNVLIDPESNDIPATGATTQQIIANVAKGGHQTFIYLGAGMTAQTADASTLVAYEPLSVYHNGTNALFGDGHSEWLTPGQLQTCLAPKPATATRPASGP